MSFFATASRDQVFINIDPSNGLYDRTRYGIDYPLTCSPEQKTINNKIPPSLSVPLRRTERLALSVEVEGPIYVFPTISRRFGLTTHSSRVFRLRRAGPNDFDQINVQGYREAPQSETGRFAFAGLPRRAVPGWRLPTPRWALRRIF